MLIDLNVCESRDRVQARKQQVVGVILCVYNNFDSS